MTDLNTSPAPGTPQTSDKAVAGALASIASAVVTYLVTGAAPDLEAVAGWGGVLGSAAAVGAFVYLLPNRPK